jgi:hypothetical protein
MSLFHSYSRRNVMLINIQRPGATRIASAASWKKNFGRIPQKGEKALYIYAPLGDKKPEKETVGETGQETKAPIPRFRLVPVFDVSQTGGKALPEIVSPLSGDVERYGALLDALRTVSPLPIEFEPMHQGQDGYCRYGEKIGIREGMGQQQTVAVVEGFITLAGNARDRRRHRRCPAVGRSVGWEPG